MDNMNQPKLVHKTNWMVIILLIVIVAIVALGIWWWTQDTAKIASLEQQVAQSEVKTSATPTPTATATATATPTVTSVDNRILLTQDSENSYCGVEGNDHAKWEKCNHEENWNFDAPTTTVAYDDATRGIKVDLPWNPNWGSEHYRIRPYDEAVGHYFVTVNFGPIGSFEGGLARASESLTFMPTKSADQLISQLNSTPEPSTIFVKPQKITVNGLEVVKFADTGLTDEYFMVVIGQKYNYQFAVWGSGTDSADQAKAFKQLEEIVKTVELI